MRILAYGIVLTWIALAAGPLAWTALLSLRDYVDAFAIPVQLFAPLTLEHYRTLWLVSGFSENALNTALLTFGTVSISLSIGCLAAYALSRTTARIGLLLLMLALAFRAMPHAALLPSFVSVFEAIGVRGSLPPLMLVLIAVNQPFTIWMLRAFFLSVPRDIDDAALVDGCTRFQAFRHVILPVMGPGLVTTGLFSFLLAYNDFLLSSALTNAENMTMPVAIASVIQADSESLLMQGIAGSMSLTIPLLLLIAVFQKRIVEGLTQGAVK
jgi:multiple sugar transport system permease protein